MANKKNLITVDIEEIENSCFVAMPFDPLFQSEYERVLRPAIEELGLKCIRADEIYSRPEIMADIWRYIRRCRLIIAELTGRNPNVLYEVGLAHAIGKPIVLLTREEKDVPFDLKSIRYRYYNVNDPFWGENLRDAISSMIQSLLEQSEFVTYLEGINIKAKMPPPPKKLEDFPKLVVRKDISGNWKASFSDHHGIMYIKQQEDKLSAIFTTTHIHDEVATVVEEFLTGTIQDSRIYLDGVSYTFIEQGHCDAYLLDHFDLHLTPAGDKMIGRVYSHIGFDSATFER